jgi:hypothetical protein
MQVNIGRSRIMKLFEPITYKKKEIMENLEVEDLVFPYNDEDMKYNPVTHQYEIQEYAFNKRGVEIRKLLLDRGIDDLNGFLLRVSQKFYLYAYKHCYMNSPILIKYIIAKLGIKTFGNMWEYRNQVVDVMVMLGEYLAYNGDTSQVSGIDLDTGNNLDIRSLRYEERDYPAEMKTLMHQLGLNYSGNYRIRVDGLGKEW